MKINSLFKFAFASAITLLLMSGCSSKLDRETAMKLMLSRNNLTGLEQGSFTYNKYSHNSPAQIENVTKLQKANCISEIGYQPIKPDSWITAQRIDFYRETTDFIISDNWEDNSKEDATVTVELDSLKFGQITGILQEKNSKDAEVHYTLIRKNVTVFGSSIYDMKEGEVVKKVLNFSNFDDGWKIND